jgi:hypothetical protein
MRKTVLVIAAVQLLRMSGTLRRCGAQTGWNAPLHLGIRDQAPLFQS